jgi:hypothetical protein
LVADTCKEMPAKGFTVGVGVGVRVAVAVAVGVPVAVGVLVIVGVPVTVGVNVGLPVGVGVRVIVDVDVTVRVGVAVGVPVVVGVRVAVGVLIVGVGVRVATVGVGVTVRGGAPLGISHFNPSRLSLASSPRPSAGLRSLGPAWRRSAAEKLKRARDGDPGASEKMTPLTTGGENIHRASIASPVSRPRAEWSMAFTGPCPRRGVVRMSLGAAPIRDRVGEPGARVKYGMATPGGAQAMSSSSSSLFGGSAEALSAKPRAAAETNRPLLLLHPRLAPMTTTNSSPSGWPAMAWLSTAVPPQPREAVSTENTRVSSPVTSPVGSPKESPFTSSFEGGPAPRAPEQLDAKVSEAHGMNTSGDPGPAHGTPVAPGGARISAGLQPEGPFGPTVKYSLTCEMVGGRGVGTGVAGKDESPGMAHTTSVRPIMPALPRASNT